MACHPPVSIRKRSVIGIMVASRVPFLVSGFYFGSSASSQLKDPAFTDRAGAATVNR